MTRPTRYLIRMVIFLAVIIALAATLWPMLMRAFLANPGLNGTILAILLLGIIWNLHLVIRLWPETRWVDILRKPGSNLTTPPPPRLLAPMASLLTARQRHKSGATLSPQAMTSVLDSLGARMDEGRDISRYVTQLLVFLGLLGTFYGLLLTVRSIADVIGGMATTGTDPAAMFDQVKTGLVKPLGGMATAFSASMFGLAGSLVLGFLDLTTGQAQNRFFNEIEEWIGTFTHLSISHSATSGTSDTPFTSPGAETLSTLQQSVNALYDMTAEAHANRQNLLALLRQMNASLEELKVTASSNPTIPATALLQKIEHHMAGLRHDLRQTPLQED